VIFDNYAFSGITLLGDIDKALKAKKKVYLVIPYLSSTVSNALIALDNANLTVITTNKRINSNFELLQSSRP